MNEIEIVVKGSNRFRPTEVAVTKQINALQKSAESAAESGDRLEKVLAKPRAKAVEDVAKALDKTADNATKAKKETEKLDDALDGVSKKGDKASKAADKAAKEAADGAKSAFTKGIDGISDALPAALGNPAAMGGVAAAALPLGAAAGGAVVLGFGTAMAGLGIASVAGTREVRSAFADMREDIADDWRDVVAPFKKTTVAIADDIESAFQSFRPTLQRTFAQMAPDVERFSGNIFAGLEKFEPAIEPLGEAFGRVMDDLGGRFPGIVENLSDSFIDLAESIERNPEALGQMIEAAGGIAGHIISDLGTLNSEFGAINEEIEMFSNWFQGGDYELDVKYKVDQDSVHEMQEAFMSAAGLGEEASRSTYDAESASERLEGAWSALADAGDDLAKRGQAVSDMLDILTGRTPTYEESHRKINDSIRDLADTFSETKNHVDGYGNALIAANGQVNTATKNGSDLYDTIQDLQDGFAGAATATRELEDAGWDHDAAVAKVNEDMRYQYDRLVESAGQMGLTKQQMRDLLATYGLTPDFLDTIARLDENGVPQKLDWIARRRTAVITGVLDWSQLPNGRSPDARAHGGISGGGWTRVGEMGEEMVKLPPGSQVMPHTESARAEEPWGVGMGGGGAGKGAPIVLDARGLVGAGLDRMFLTWLTELLRTSGSGVEVLA